MSVPDFEVAPDTPLGALLDSVIRQAALLHLGDYYLGSQADYDKRYIAVYFSEDAKEEALQELRDNLAGKDVEGSLEKTSDQGAAWVLMIQQPVEEITSPPSTGEIPVSVQFSGEVSVAKSPS